MKKLFKILQYLVLGCVGLILLLTLTAWVYIKINQGTEKELFVTYLQQNQRAINLTSENTFKGAFSKDFYQNRIFLLGESHGYEVPQVLDLKLVKHLHQQIKLRNYLAEIDCGQAYYLNKYLRTGNEENLKKVFGAWRTEQWGNKNFYNKVVAIRQFNQTLPAEEHIRFVGIDRIQDISLNQDYLRELISNLPENKISAYNFNLLLSTDSAAQCPPAMAANAAVVLKNLKQTDNFLKDQAPLKHLLVNLHYYKIKNRDSVMVKNFLALEEANNWQKEPFYGLWGYSHTLQAPLESGFRFAGLLKKTKPSVASQLVSINLAYVNSEMMLPQGGPFSPPDGKTTLANSNGPLAFQDGIKDLTAAATHQVTLFKLNAPGSPYAKSNRLATIKGILGDNFIPRSGEVTTNYFQYVILVNGSKAVEPLSW